MIIERALSGHVNDAWPALVGDLLSSIDREFHAHPGPEAVWRKRDGSTVTDLDYRFDSLIRVVLSKHLQDAAVLSEEFGLLSPASRSGACECTAIVDPVDGTESLVRGLSTWWVSVAIRDESGGVWGFLYQPVTRTLHDSGRPAKTRCKTLVVGVSPDRLNVGAERLIREADAADGGVELLATPHATGKIAAVLEGRCLASLYVPTNKSPSWHSWDLAAGLALAKANGLELRTLDGRALSLQDVEQERREAWLCAYDLTSWERVHAALA